MAGYRDDALMAETLERIRRAELATVLYPRGTPEHARAVERLGRATQRMCRLTDESRPSRDSDGVATGGHGTGARTDPSPR